MGDADLNIHLLMGDQDNATQLVMETRLAHVAPCMDTVVTLRLTAHVLDARTSGSMVSSCLSTLVFDSNGSF